MMQYIKFLYSFFVYGEWRIGFETRKTWPTKSYWSLGRLYYDGYYYYLNIGWFYIAVYH